MIKDFIVQKWNALHDIRAEPEAVAGGVAIGMFLGFTPFVGFKTILALLIAWLARCSKLAAVIAVTCHDLLLPAAPFFIWAEYKLGHWILRMPVSDPPHRVEGHSFMALMHNWTMLFEWNFFSTYIYPVLIGSFALGLPVGVFFYFLTHTVLVKVRRRRALAAAHAAQEDLTIGPPPPDAKSS